MHRCLCRTKALLLLSSLFFSLGIHAQNIPRPFSITLQSYFGSFITGAPKATYIRDSYTHFTEVSLSRQTDGSKQWHRYNKYPQTGVSLIFGNPGSRRFVGRSFSIYPFINFSLLSARKFKSGLRIGTGISYVAKPYNAQNNHKNTIIGSHLNNYIHGSLENEVQLHRRLYLHAGIAFAHISNGGVKLPNFGLNFVTVTSGIRYAFGQHPSTDSATTRENYKKDVWRINSSVGVKQTPWAGSPRYAVAIVGGEYMKRVSGGSGIGGGIDVFYDPSLTKDPSGYKISTEESENVQLAAHLLYERNLGRLSVPVQLGVYFLNPSRRGSFYQNFGLRYALSPHVAAFYNLKIHAGKADYIHGGVSYTF